MAFSFDGHLLDTRNLIRHEPQPYPLKTLTYLCSNHNSLKILLTEHAMNTAIRTLHAHRILQIYDIPLIPQIFINSLVPSFKNAFGTNNQIRIVIDANDA